MHHPLPNGAKQLSLSVLPSHPLRTSHKLGTHQLQKLVLDLRLPRAQTSHPWAPHRACRRPPMHAVPVLRHGLAALGSLPQCMAHACSPHTGSAGFVAAWHVFRLFAAANPGLPRDAEASHSPGQGPCSMALLQFLLTLAVCGAAVTRLSLC